ncbi:MAG: CRISPR-associated primase-polymerase type A1 [Candidatus Methylomirabilales bacterium]
MRDAFEILAAAIEAGEAEARPRLREAVAARRGAAGDHARWGRLCERAGEAGLALTEYQLALRDDPEDVAALSRLCTLYEERGEAERAVECAESWARAAPGDAEPVTRLLDLLVAADHFERARAVLEGPVGQTLGAEARRAWGARLRAAAAAEGEGGEAEPGPSGLPSDADVVRFLHLFAGRENVYARQWADERGEGGYTPVREPLSVAAARNHLLGNLTLGVYPIRLDNTVTFFAFDLDVRKAALARARSSLDEARRIKEAMAQEALRVQAELAALEIPCLLEDSGYKGRHLWVFLEVPEDAAVVRQFGSLFLRCCPPAVPDLQLEFFPKQASAGSGIGNLIKLPLGIHRRTGRRSRLLQPDGTPVSAPYAALREQPRISRTALYSAIATLKARTAAAPAAPEPMPDAEPAARPDQAALREAFVPPPPAWTSADFETNAEIAHLLHCCPVLAALKRKVEEHRRLTHDEQVVLAHSLGHSGAGVLAVNHLLDACVDVPATARLQSVLAGNPISCPKIRKRIPHVTGSVACNCRFEVTAGQYPTPRLHLATLPAPSPRPAPVPAWDPVERVRALRVLRLRRQELESEIAQLEQDLVAHLASSATPEVAMQEGTLRLVQEAGAPPVLLWEPRQAESPPTPPETAARGPAQ